MNPSNGFYDKCNGYVMLGKEQKRMVNEMFDFLDH
jgi:hypothetical protein